MHREEEYLYNKKPSYGVLWKHSSLALQNSIRGTIDYTQMSELDDAMQLRGNVKRLCTVGVVTKANPGKVQRDADFRFSRVHQYANQSVSSGWCAESKNAFVESEIIIEEGHRCRDRRRECSSLSHPSEDSPKFR